MDIPLPQHTNILSGIPEGIEEANALSKAKLERKKMEIENQFAPQKYLSDYEAKMAYARLLGPQYTAKLMGNKDILASTPNAQNIISSLIAAGNSGSPGNAFAPQNIPTQKPEKDSNFFSSMLKKIFGGANQAQPESNPNALYSSPSSVSPENNQQQPMEQAPQNGEIQQAMVAWMKSPEAMAQMQQDGELSIPDAPTLLSWYRGQQGGQPAAPSASAAPSTSTEAPAPSPTIAENTAKYEGIVEEGKESGKVRANDIKEFGDLVLSGQTKQVTLDELSKIVTSPAFEQIRQIPLAGRHELSYYAKFGTPEQKEMVGKYYTDTGEIVKDTAGEFKGSFRAGEQQLVNGMKANPADTVDVARGKIEAMSILNKLLVERSRLAGHIMEKEHISKLDALDKADKQLDGNGIRHEVYDQLHPTVTITNKKTGEKKQVSIQEARQLGAVPNV